VAKWSAPDETVTWKICGLAEGKWKLAISGLYKGDGIGEVDSNWSGEYKVQYSSTDSVQKESGTLTYACQPDKICDCLKYPGNKECAGVDTSTVQYFLSAKMTDFDITLLSSRGNIHAEGHDPQYGGILWQTYTIKRLKIDKPCKPEDASGAQP
jgi:hypothetical protein